jgi:hypothetical protein
MTATRKSRKRNRTPAGERLSERERRFVEYFMGEAAGNATQAARLAGYSAKSARHQASRLLTKRNILGAIAARRENDPQIMTRIERQQLWSDMARARGEFKHATIDERRKASELLGKSQADFVEVRVAPIVSDPHASEDQLIAKVREFLRLADERARETSRRNMKRDDCG